MATKADSKTNRLFLKKLVITSLVLTLTLGLSLLTWRWTQSRTPLEPDDQTTERPSYTQLSISKDERVIAVIRHQDRKLSFEASDPALYAYLLVNLKIWEQQQLEYPTGGRLPGGGFWDGSMTTDASKSDFLIGIWMLLEEKLGPEYSFDPQP